MTTATTPPPGRRAPGLLLVVAWLASGRAATAEDWGAYAIAPASAPGFVLETVGPEQAEGAVVSIGRPSGSAKQKWVIVPRDKDLFGIKPSYESKLVLAASRGGVKNGTAIVLEADEGEPWQSWSLRKNDDGSYGLVPGHAAEKGLDLLGGKAAAGAKVDLWEYRAADRHLQWLIRPLAGTPAQATGGAGESPPSAYVAPQIEPGDVPAGEIKEFTYSDSKIFPGTQRQGSVFIPAQYDGSKPACVYVKFDGYNPREKPLLEAMIATREMPVTIGVFIRPGIVPAPMKGTIGRRNRCFEYDGVGDDNARFLVEELLPFVARTFDLKLSDRGDDRCLAGGSSGGIAAFNAAWQRPDAFRRVYANSGSFVAFRGGHEFPTLVRKTEPKPIRAFLTTGMRDMENAAGDWFLLDQEMDKALKFSGYDYTFRIINGGHVAGYYDCFREAMAYLWKGWPGPVKPGAGAPRVRDILLPDEPWTLVAKGLDDVKAPACNARGEVYFVEAGAIRRIDRDGTIRPFARGSEADGLSFGPKGELYAVSSRTGRVTRHDADGKASPVVEGLPGRHILAMPDGGLYVTTQGGEVWFVKDGEKTRVDSGLKDATGLAYRPDRWLLSVADGDSKWVYSYQIVDDGRLANRERFFWLHVPDGEDDAGAESVCYAKEGPMFVATRSGLQVCADDGPTQVILPLPGGARPVGVCLGGEGMDTLFALCGDRIYARKVKVHGIGAFTPWTAVPGSKL